MQKLGSLGPPKTEYYLIKIVYDCQGLGKETRMVQDLSMNGLRAMDGIRRRVSDDSDSSYLGPVP